VIYTRTFKKNVASTIMLPFSILISNVSGGNFYTFKGVEYDEEAGKYVCTMTDANKVDITFVANKPYLFMPSADGQITFNGGVKFAATSTSGDSGSTAVGGTSSGDSDWGALRRRAKG